MCSVSTRRYAEDESARAPALGIPLTEADINLVHADVAGREGGIQ